MLKTAAAIVGILVLSCMLAYAARFGYVPTTGSSLGRLVGHDTASAAGRRFFTASFTPDRLTVVGAYRPVQLESVGYTIRLTGDGAPSGLYFVYTVERESAFAVTLRGRPLAGGARVSVRRWKRAESLGAVPNLLQSPDDLSVATVWLGSGRATQVPAPAGKPLVNRVTFDNTHTYFYQSVDSQTLDGMSYQVSFRGRLVSGGPRFTTFINRAGGFDAQSQNLSLTPDWRRYTLRHDGRWTGVSPAQLGLARIDDMVFELRDLRMMLNPSFSDLAGIWPKGARLDPASIDASSAFEAPAGTATQIVRDADAVGVLLEGIGPFEYQLERICVDAIDRDEEAAARAAACTPMLLPGRSQ